MLLNKYTSDTFNRVMEAKSLRLSLKIYGPGIQMYKRV